MAEYELAGRMLGALAVLVAILFGLQFLAKSGLRAKVSAANNGRIVRVLETTFLPNSSTMHVVKVGERYYVVGQSGSHIAMLCEVPDDAVGRWLEAQPASPLQSAPVAKLVARFINRRA